MVHRAHGDPGLDFAGHFSVPDTAKKNPQRALYQREASLGPPAEEDISAECLPTGGGPHGRSLRAATPPHHGAGLLAFIWRGILPGPQEHGAG